MITFRFPRAKSPLTWFSPNLVLKNHWATERLRFSRPLLRNWSFWKFPHTRQILANGATIKVIAPIARLGLVASNASFTPIFVIAICPVQIFENTSNFIEKPLNNLFQSGEPRFEILFPVTENLDPDLKIEKKWFQPLTSRYLSRTSKSG